MARISRRATWIERRTPGMETHALGAETSMRRLLSGKAPLIPVLHMENADHAEPVLQTLEQAGIGAVEVTLRTAAATEVIARMRRAATSAIVGAGTVTRPEEFRRVCDAGAQFVVSPALTVDLAIAASDLLIPFLPGVATPTEALRARELGFHELKFFPADLFGGVGFLRHIHPLFPDLVFCPTGGVSNDNVRSYLNLGNVFAAGGVYLAPRAVIEAEQWTSLSALAQRAVAALAGGESEHEGRSLALPPGGGAPR
jgi:2-dehydro-3-deoxyphosphogluconate aldolase/(4S)-4-hydroxy-2-oxoglutarate aldolase